MSKQKNKAIKPGKNNPRILRKMTPEQRHSLFGQILELQMASEFHQKFTVTDFPLWYLPAIDLNQFRIYHKGKKPVGWVTWAWLTEETERQFIQGDYTLRPKDWNAGDRLWFIDFIAPYGDAKNIIADLGENFDPEQSAKAIRVSDDGSVRTVCDFRGTALRQKMN